MFNFTSGAGRVCGGSANPVPVVVENFLYLGAQNPSASPVKEVAPPVRGGEFTVRYVVKSNCWVLHLFWKMFFLQKCSHLKFDFFWMKISFFLKIIFFSKTQLLKVFEKTKFFLLQSWHAFPRPHQSLFRRNFWQKAKNDQMFLDFLARTGCQKNIFFSHSKEWSKL